MLTSTPHHVWVWNGVCKTRPWVSQKLTHELVHVSPPAEVPLFSPLSPNECVMFDVRGKAWVYKSQGVSLSHLLILSHSLPAVTAWHPSGSTDSLSLWLRNWKQNRSRGETGTVEEDRRTVYIKSTVTPWVGNGDSQVRNREQRD